ncbi:MAG: hypothetical protein ACYCVH_05915 [Ignavibacteriaceae bacterium]
MKNKYLTGLIFLAAGITFFSGCYTTVWMPDQNLPDSTQTVDNFYPDVYFGNYGNYYNSPWWNSYSLPSYQTNSPAYNRDSSQAQSFIRNNESGRSSPLRNAFLNLVSPATAVRNSSSTTSTSTSTNNNATSGGTARVENSNSGTKDSSSNRSSSSDKNNSTRNNDGSRNTNGRK